MPAWNIELVGGPKPGKHTIDVVGTGEAPPEITVKIAEGPRIRVEEAPGGSVPGVTTYAVYRFAEVGSDGVLVYAYSNERDVQG